MLKTTDRTYTFEATAGDVTVSIVVDTAATVSVAGGVGSSTLTMPLEALELVQSMLTQLLDDPDVTVLIPAPVEDPEPEP